MNSPIKIQTKKNKTKNNKNTFFYKILENKNLIKLGSGSYGTIYILGDNNSVMKEHIISGSTNATCYNWKQEFNNHKFLYKTLKKILESIGVSIVKPYKFYYADFKNNKRYLKNNVLDSELASSCLYTMEFISGRKHNKKSFDDKIINILKENSTIGQGDWVPPYMFLGGLKNEDGPIFLDMLTGTTIKDFFREELSYCYVYNTSYSILHSMFLSFFIIINTGYIPRDIEFVFNGLNNKENKNIYVSILDFNEVRSIKTRNESYGDFYDINLDIAHVYIDLCGLRAGEDRNPMAKYDLPTPQWKFLCSPLIAPQAFIQLCNNLEKDLQTLNIFNILFNIDKFFLFIISYLKLHYLDNINNKIPMEYKELFALRPTNIYTIKINDKIPDGFIKIGDLTEYEFIIYYSKLAHFCDNYFITSILDRKYNNNIKLTYLVQLPYNYGVNIGKKYNSIKVYDINKYLKFDIEYQQYIILSLIDTLIKRNIFHIDNIKELYNLKYDDIIEYCQNKFQRSIVKYNINNWGEIF